MLNQASIIGNVGDDPTIRTTSAGKKIASFSCATTEKFKNSNGVQETRTAWHRIVVLNDHLVPIVESYVRKGSKLFLQGRIAYRTWEDANKVRHDVAEIVLGPFGGTVELLSPKPEGGR